MRSSNNLIKRIVIRDAANKCGKSAQVLDVGCGCGGDLKKWQHAGIRCLDMCDPDADSLREAESRAASISMKPKFFLGDIQSCPQKKYDIICFNFSLHYIYQSADLFFKSINGIQKRLKSNGQLVGCIPDSESILEYTPFRDELGNMFLRKDGTGYGAFGEKLFVKLADTPFYKDGMRSEPICYKDMLITHLEKKGIKLISWERFQVEHEIQKFYSRFIFVKE
ncbi:mRNA cap guanine-N7 methyltransferase [bacterium]|nr:mRNA cap guanine-N7 methyltransferase [bacterium]